MRVRQPDKADLGPLEEQVDRVVERFADLHRHTAAPSPGSDRRLRETRRAARVRRRPSAPSCERSGRRSRLDQEWLQRFAHARRNGGGLARRAIDPHVHEAPARGGRRLVLAKQRNLVSHRRSGRASPRAMPASIDFGKRQRTMEAARRLDDEADDIGRRGCRGRLRGSGARSPPCRSTSSRSRC